MSKKATQADSGFRNRRVEFVREDEPGVIPSDPDWELFSNTLETAFQWDVDAGMEAQRGIGDYEIKNHFSGVEDHSGSIDYHLQRFFVDEDGDSLDPAGDAILRADDGSVKNTHTIIDRTEYDGARTYVVARGCHPELSDVSGDPGSSLPIVVSLDYEIMWARMYRVHQPTESTLTVSSTSAEDIGITLELESDHASTSESVTLDGTTAVTTTEMFDSLDAFELSESAQGEVVVEDEQGKVLVRIRGSEDYDGADGDLGVPTLGGGSHADPLTGGYEVFLNDKITKGGEDLAAEVRSVSFDVSNNYEKDPVLGSAEQVVHIGERDVEFDASFAGDFGTYESIVEHLTTAEFDLQWEMDGGTITFKDAVVESPGNVGPSQGDVVSVIDNSFEAKSIELDAK